MKYRITDIPTGHIDRAVRHVSELCVLAAGPFWSLLVPELGKVADISLVSYDGIDAPYQSDYSSGRLYHGGVSLAAIHARSPIGFRDSTRMGLVEYLAAEFHRKATHVVIAENCYGYTENREPRSDSYRSVSIGNEWFAVLDAKHVSRSSLEAITREAGGPVFLALCSGWSGELPRVMTAEAMQGVVESRTHLIVEVFDGEGYLVCRFQSAL